VLSARPDLKKYSDLQLEGYPVEQGAVIKIPLPPPGARGPAEGFG
jgi:hypothetical protein